MARTSKQRRLMGPWSMQALIPLAAGVALALALGMAVLAVRGDVVARVDIPGFGLGGTVGFGIDPAGAALLASLLLAAAATILTSSAHRAALFSLIVATVLAVLAREGFTAGFWALAALLIAVRGHTEAFALAALPMVAIVLARTQAPAVLDPAFAVGGGMAMLAAGVWAARTLKLGQLARAVALGFAGLGLLAAGMGAVSAALLAVMANATIAPLLGIAATTLDEATGTTSLDWLGGLARGMPRFALLTLAGLAFAAILPPGPGFAAFSAVWQAAIAARSGAVIGVLALWFGLMGFAGLRGFGLACLGRPRSLRAAAAEDAARPVLIALALLAAGGAVLGLADPAMLALAAVLAMLAAGLRWLLTRTGPLDVAGFEGGFARPPAWLPFGDPATQITATGFAAPLRPPSRLVAALTGLRCAVRWLASAFRPPTCRP
ncbi:MAG: hypothetical protein PHT60_01440 [Acidiphilium sp.]|nr:hypothetical protein [Acidiphilium sp.]MDD4934419.1 hypothetical protein [Acidiphilium sp.]